MSLLHVAMCSLLTGLSAAFLAAAVLWGNSCAAASAALLDRDMLRRVLYDNVAASKTPSLAQRMRAAGFPFGTTTLVAACVACGAATGAGCVALGLGGPLAFLAAAVGAVMPQTLVKAAISRFERRVKAALPALIDGVRRGLDSGLDLSASLALATENMPAETARIFGPAVRSILLGRTMAESMDVLRASTQSPEVQVFASALSIGADSGGRLNDSLGALAKALRDDIRARDRLAIAASEATSTSHILLALPAGVILGMAMFAPGSFALLTGTPAGQGALTLSVLWVVIGILLLRRIVSGALNAASR